MHRFAFTRWGLLIIAQLRNSSVQVSVDQNYTGRRIISCEVIIFFACLHRFGEVKFDSYPIVIILSKTLPNDRWKHTKWTYMGFTFSRKIYIAFDHLQLYIVLLKYNYECTDLYYDILIADQSRVKIDLLAIL